MKTITNFINKAATRIVETNQLMEEFNLTKIGAQHVLDAVNHAKEQFSDIANWTLVYVDNTREHTDKINKKGVLISACTDLDHLADTFKHAAERREISKTRIVIVTPTGKILDEVIDESTVAATVDRLTAITIVNKALAQSQPGCTHSALFT